jgi:hypothetical protein
LPREDTSNKALIVRSTNQCTLRVPVQQLVGPPKLEDKHFQFDGCYDKDTQQVEIFRDVGETILQNALAGFNGCLFAYGQTGSGKSHSVMGPATDPGIVPRLAEALFATEAKAEGTEFRVSASYLEIYNEVLKDLLNPNPRKKPLYIHQHVKLGVYVPHLSEAAVTCYDDCLKLLDFGNKVRATAQTNMNSRSSRSHSVFTMRIQQVYENGATRHSTLNLIDLAGSERVKKSGSVGQAMREGQNINQSLSVLGQVISKLAAGRLAHVPFRQSKLTYLLHDALVGNSKTFMLANVSPSESESEETLSTLRFAQTVKKIKLEALANDLDPEEPELVLQTIQEELQALKEELGKSQRGQAMKSPRSRRMAKLVDAQEALLEQYSSRTRWFDKMKPMSKEMEEVREDVLTSMALPVDNVGKLLGMSPGPFLLNISDDPALSGCLLYFLKQDGKTTIGTASDNDIRLEGLGISEHLCSFAHASGRVRLTKESTDGRLSVNGMPVGESAVQLSHGDRLVLGRAFVFRILYHGEEATAKTVTGSVPAAPMTYPVGDPAEEFKAALNESIRGSEAGGGGLQSAISLNNELRRRDLSDDAVTKFMGTLNPLSHYVDEANEITAEVKPHGGLFMDVGIVTGVNEVHVKGVPPQIVVQLWKRSILDELTGPMNRELLAVWPVSKFHVRLEAMRDIFHECCQKRKEHQGLQTAWVPERSRDPWRDWDDTQDPEEEDEVVKTPEDPDVDAPTAVLRSAGGSSEADDEALPVSGQLELGVNGTLPLEYNQPPVPDIR